MSRIASTFTQLQQAKRKALIPFITAGDPNREFTVPLMHAMVDAGADIIELGVPFSDPMADGQVIQRASTRALQNKMNLRGVLELAIEFRKNNTSTPLVLMGYLNPIECMGYEAFANAVQRASIDGVLTIDIPPEESDEYINLLQKRGIDPIYLLAPNSTEARIKKVNACCSGYIYYVSLKGITGASHLDTESVRTKLQQIRRNTTLPISVGFGIKDAATAKIIAEVADAVVVGSALVNHIEQNLKSTKLGSKKIVKLLRSMRQAMDDYL